MKNQAVFLDRDGTVIRDREYLADPAGVELLKGAAAGIKALRQAGFMVIVATNQSGVARGFFTEQDIKRVNERMQELLAVEGAGLDGIYYCPHYPEGKVQEYVKVCYCRKPGPDMLFTAAQERNVDLFKSWVIGDKPTDIEFGFKQGLRTILVLTGYGRETQSRGFNVSLEPDLIVPDLEAAAAKIIAAGDGYPGK